MIMTKFTHTIVMRFNRGEGRGRRDRRKQILHGGVTVTVSQKVGVSCHMEGSSERGYSAVTFGSTTVDLDQSGRASASVPIRLASDIISIIYYISSVL